jgi:hypothetical protein
MKNHGAKRVLLETFARIRPDNSLNIKTVSMSLDGNRQQPEASQKP